jgi:broad specificity phosphatase PhoE
VSTLTLVRHGQAIPFQKEAGLLSALGDAQAARLGRYWSENGIRFDEVYSGCLPRQIRTEQMVAAAFQEAGELWPSALRDPAWNEYDAPGVLSRLVAADVRAVVDDPRAFQRMFASAMQRWVVAEEPLDGVEPWPAFRDRVSGAIRRIMAGGSNRRVAVFTSGGPIGMAVQLAMKAPAESFLEVNWRIRNGSVTEFIFDRERFTLDSFNCIGHLDEPGLRTYR